jgi:ABC-2 type transport system permease protein
VYYLSLTALFLILNIVSLDSKGWSRAARNTASRWNTALRVALVAANLVALNVWLFPLGSLRADITARHEYSLSQTTLDLLHGLQEPLLLRGYFSARTHPLLAPLVPTVRDLLNEYKIASGGKVRVEWVDPQTNPELEAEANDVYGIKSTPFHVAGRYEESLISSYFDILVKYGDQFQVLTFSDLIEVRSSDTSNVDVGLRNPEYDITRSIKKVVYGFQSLDSVFASLPAPAKMTAYVTPATLPAEYKDTPALLQKVATTIQQESGGKFTFEMLDPTDPNSGVTAQKLADSYGLTPFRASLFSGDTFFFHVLLQVGNDTPQLSYPSPQMTEADIRNEIEAALKRSAPGFLKTIGLWAPSEQPVQSPFGGTQQPVSTWQMIRQQLGQNYTVQDVDLGNGIVPSNVDVLVVIAPRDFTDRQRFAIDQYLMKGGAVILATGNYLLSPMQYGGGIMMDKAENGVQALLQQYGVSLGAGMVLDPQNEAFPIQTQRTVNGMQVNELQQMDYPFFVDVRQNAMATNSPIVSALQAITLQWASPVEVDATKNANRQVTVLLKSTDKSWVRDAADVQPNMDTYKPYGFPIEGEQKSRTLAVAVRGSFESAFKGKAAPFGPGSEPTPAPGMPTPTPTPEPTASVTPEAIPNVIETSPESARLVVVGSAEFVDDAVLQISQSMSQDRYLNNLQFLQNAVDWSVEDEDLLSIRTRGTYANMLKPLTQSQQSMWEIGNYAVALLGLAALGIVWSTRRRHEQPMHLMEVRGEQAIEG